MKRKPNILCLQGKPINTTYDPQDEQNKYFV